MVTAAVPTIPGSIPPSTFVASVLEPGSALGRRRVTSVEETVHGPPLSDHVVLLIQQWLTVALLPATLQCFVDEYTRTQHHAPPTLDKWYEMTQTIDLSAIAATASLDTLHEPNPALLERIVAHMFVRFRRRPESATIKPPATVFVSSKRPATAAPMLKFSSKRSLPMGSTPSSSSHIKSMTAIPSPAVRPQSAMVVAASRSTPALVPRDLPLNNNALEKRSTTPPSPKTGPTTRQAASPKKNTEPRRSTNSIRLSLSQSSHAPPSPSPNKATDRKQSTITASSATEKKTSGDARPEVEEVPESTVELEDMTEEHLAEHFSGFSKDNIKKLRRVLAKSSAHSQALQRSRLALDKIQLRAQQQHERSSLAAKQTVLLSTTMDMLIKEPCSLCRFVFLKKNLTTKVSFKSICDLRASWQTPHPRGASHTGLTDAPAYQEDEEEKKIEEVVEAEPPVSLVSTQQISHLYDEVPVCVFCAQLALDFSSYRPSSAERKERKEMTRQRAVEIQKQRDLERQRDRLKCDPLAFHAYELNSDDDDDEVLEVDATGRVQVVRRPRGRRRTIRTPAQTGLVSKRIHYDHLRSQSVHALNRQEWEVISHGYNG